MTVLELGESRILEGTFLDEAGALSDPTTAELVLTDPLGAETTIAQGSLTHVSTGVFRFTVEFDQVGTWFYRWNGEGAVDEGSTTSLFVLPLGGDQRRAWCSLDDVRDSPWLRAIADADLRLDLLDDAIIAATRYLHDKTHRRFRGLRSVELRPCCSCTFRHVGSWLPWRYGWHPESPAPPLEGVAPCGCSSIHEVELPPSTLFVMAVRVDGAVVAAGDWRLDRGHRLVRTDGEPWPCCQDLERADTEEGTFSVGVVAGEAEHAMGRFAAVELAAELYLAMADPASCRIPTKVREVVRQGVTYRTIEPMTLEGDKLGLRICDMFTGEYGKRRQRARMASPDVPETARRVG